MNPKISLVLLAGALYLAPAWAQDDSPTPIEAAPVAAPAPAVPRVAAEAFVWRFAPPVGSRWTVRSFERATIKTIALAVGDAPDASDKNLSSRHVVADYDVLSRDQFGATTSRLTLRELKFSSAEIESGETTTFADERTEALQKTLRGASFTIKQSPTGEIWGIANTESVTNRIAAAVAPYDFDGAPSAQELQARAQMMTESLIGPAVLRRVLGLSQAPSYPIVTSETWNYAVALPERFPFAFELPGTLSLNRLTPAEAFIASNATYNANTSPVKPALKPGKTRFTSEADSIKASVRGTFRVERNSGLTLESTSSWRVSSTILARSKDAPDAPPTRSTGEATIEIHTLLEPR